MGAKIVVANRNHEPVAGAEVFVFWSPSGFSKATTNKQGVADLGTEGTIKEVRVWDRVVWSVERRLKDGDMFEVTYG